MSKSLTGKELEEIVAQVTYLDWSIDVRYDGGENDRPYLQIHFTAPCSKTGVVQEWAGAKWWLGYWMCKAEILSTVYKAVEAAVRHEMRENFKYRGRAIHDPHIDPDRLWELAGDPDAFNIREPRAVLAEEMVVG